MKITVLPLQEALGRPLAHDLTQIDAVAGTKVARFKKGQVIGPEDVPVLLSMGREHLQMLELEPHEVHEDDAARELARVRVAASAVPSPKVSMKMRSAGTPMAIAISRSWRTARSARVFSLPLRGGRNKRGSPGDRSPGLLILDPGS